MRLDLRLSGRMLLLELPGRWNNEWVLKTLRHRAGPPAISVWNVLGGLVTTVAVIKGP